MPSSPYTHCNGTGWQNPRFSGHTTFCDPTSACSPCARIADIQRRIDDMRRALDELFDEKEAMADAFNAEHDRLCHKLPNELISKVFFHTLPLRPSSYVFQKSNQDLLRLHKRSIQRLNRVCRRWRMIARKTPELWRIISANFMHSIIPRGLNNLWDWLQFSGQLPLYLLLTFPPRESKEFRELFPTIVSSLLPHLSRLVVMEILASDKALSYFSPHLMSLHLQNLKIILSTDVHLKLNTAPRLLTITHGKADISFSNWTSLNFLHLRRLSEAKLLYIFKNALNLLTCEIGQLIPEDEFGSGAVTHDVLQNFDIFEVSQTFWDRVCLPSLRKLTVHVQSDPGVDYSTSVTAFLQRSRCPLHSLRYHYANSEEDIMQLLAHTPTLAHLNFGLSQHALTESFFRRATLPPSPNLSANDLSLVKNLQSLKCGLLNTQTFDWEVFISFLKSRSYSSGGTLRSLEINASLHNIRDADSTVDGSLDEDAEESFTLDPAIVDAIIEAAGGTGLYIVDNNGGIIIEHVRAK